MQEFKVCHHYFINSALSSVIRGFADYFGNTFFERTQDIVISTYEKGVQHYINRMKSGGERMAPKYPFIVFNPELDFEPDPQAGRFLWGYPNFMGSFAAQLFEPFIYDDDNLSIGTVMNRYKGRFEIIVWCSSVYELIDFRLQTLQLFGGLDRPIIPKGISGNIIIPDELVTYSYENPYTGNSYSLDWEANNAEIALIKNIGSNKMVYPFVIKPWLKLTDVSDGSEKYGGSGDELSEHRLTLNLEWECAIPTHMGLIATMRPDYSQKVMDDLSRRDVSIKFNLDLDYEYRFEFNDPDTGEVINYSDVPHTVMDMYGDEDATSVDDRAWSEGKTYINKYQYVITEDDHTSIQSDPAVNFTVTLPETIIDPYMIRVYGKYGQLQLDHQWRLSDESEVEFISFNLTNLQAGDNIWFALYEADA